MAHECDDCGESFETLSRLRLHDCGSGAGTDPDPSLTDDRDESVPELDDALDRVSDGEYDAIFGTVAAFESTLSAALDGVFFRTNAESPVSTWHASRYPVSYP